MTFIINLLITFGAFFQVCWVLFSLTFGWRIFLITALCWWAGSGLRGSLYGDLAQKKIGLIGATALLTLSFFLVSFFAQEIDFYGLHRVALELWQYLILTFAIGFIFTSKRFAR